MMNERIHQLAHRAGVTVVVSKDIEDVVDGSYIIGPAAMKKFIDAIVGECLLKVNGAKIRNESYTELIERIKEDFGVEE